MRFIVRDSWQEKNSDGVLVTRFLREEVDEKGLLDFAWEHDIDTDDVWDAVRKLEEEGFKVQIYKKKRIAKVVWTLCDDFDLFYEYANLDDHTLCVDRDDVKNKKGIVRLLEHGDLTLLLNKEIDYVIVELDER